MFIFSQYFLFLKGAFKNAKIVFLSGERRTINPIDIINVHFFDE